MWMSDPIPVTTRIMTADNGSRRRVRPTLKSPDVIHVNACWTMERSSGASAISRQSAAPDVRNAAMIAAHARPPEAPLLSRRPKLALTRKPTKGKSGIRSSIDPLRAVVPSWPARAFVPSWPPCSPFQRRKGIGVERLAVPEQADHDREPDRGFRGRDGHDEEDDDLAVRGAQRPSERDERQVHGVQHDLDRQQDRNEVAPREDTGGPDREQNGREHQIVVEGHH